MTWQPIETAPKDGTTILLVMRTGKMITGWWASSVELFIFVLGPDDGNSFGIMAEDATHWMPLPEAPHD